VIYDHPIPNAKTTAARPGLYDLTARLVARNDSLIALRPLPEVLIVDATNVRATDGGSLYPQQDFAVAGMRNWQGAQFNLSPSRQIRSSHALVHGFHQRDFMVA